MPRADLAVEVLDAVVVSTALLRSAKSAENGMMCPRVAGARTVCVIAAVRARRGRRRRVDPRYTGI